MLTDSPSTLKILFHSSKFLSSHFCLAITVLRVDCRERLYSALTRDSVAKFLSSSLLISHWLLRFVLASLMEVWIGFLKNWFIIDYILQESSSIHPNLVITFLLGNYSVESWLSQIVVFGIDMRQCSELLKFLRPHLTFVAQICACIIDGSLDWVLKHCV